MAIALMSPNNSSATPDLMIAVLTYFGWSWCNECTPDTRYVKSIALKKDYDDPVKLTFGKSMRVRIKGWARTTTQGWTRIKCGDTTIVSTSTNTTNNFDTVVEVSEGTVLAITTSYHEQQTWICDILTV